MKFFDVGVEAHGVIAIGQLATGVFAFGQMALGVVAIGQLSRGIIAVGQLSLGFGALGQLAVSPAFAAGMVGVGGLQSKALLPIRLRPTENVSPAVNVVQLILYAAVIVLIGLAVLEPLWEQVFTDSTPGPRQLR